MVGFQYIVEGPTPLGQPEGFPARIRSTISLVSSDYRSISSELTSPVSSSPTKSSAPTINLLDYLQCLPESLFRRLIQLVVSLVLVRPPVLLTGSTSQVTLGDIGPITISPTRNTVARYVQHRRRASPSPVRSVPARSCIAGHTFLLERAQSGIGWSRGEGDCRRCISGTSGM